MSLIILGVVGNKNTGKSTFISKCSKLLSNMGYKVAIIKFSHSRFTLDPQNKDTLLFRDSEAEKFIFTSPYEQVTYQKVQERKIGEEIFLEGGKDVDIIFCESYPNNLKNIPLIFTISDYEDYLKIKTRYKDQKPIFITGTLHKISKNSLDNIPVLKIDLINHQTEIIRKILTIRALNSNS
jgi:molybdopterin-guanine dinucleotide biosynthesis protein MobB